MMDGAFPLARGLLDRVWVRPVDLEPSARPSLLLERMRETRSGVIGSLLPYGRLGLCWLLAKVWIDVREVTVEG